MTKPKIYIPNKGAHDFSLAAELGELVFLTEGMISINSIGSHYRTFLPIIERSDSGDYILICGPTSMNAILCSLFVLKHQRLNLLIWSVQKNGEGVYRKRNLIFTKPKGE